MFKNFLFAGMRLTPGDGYVSHMEYSPIIGGYCMVLSSGKAVLLMSTAMREERVGGMLV